MPARRFDRVVSRRGAVWIWLVPLALIGLFFALLVPTMCRAREPANRIKCASNLRQIGLALRQYADAHGGALPPDLSTLAATADVTADVFCCPTSATVDRAPGTQPAEWSPHLTDPHYCSYRYAAAAELSGLTDDDVLAFEPPDDHNGDGMNVLYADGHTDWVAVRRRPDGGGLDYAAFYADFERHKRPLRTDGR